MEALNTGAFALLNAGANPNPVVLTCARAIAVWGLYLTLLAPLLVWLKGSKRQRVATVGAGLGVAVAMAVNEAIAVLWFHPRPFMTGAAANLLEHSPDSSFPSDHVTLVASMGFGLLIGGASAGGGWTLLAAALVIGWSRIFLGAHWPLDVVGSFVVASCAGLIARWIGIPLAVRATDIWWGVDPRRGPWS